MGFLRYWKLVLRMAFTHSLGFTHNFLLIIAILVGLASSFLPKFNMGTDVHGWQVSIVVLSCVFLFRISMVSYWIYNEQQIKINTLTARNRKYKEQFATNAIARFDRNGGELPGCINIAKISKKDTSGDATSSFVCQFVKPMKPADTICNTMSGTPSYAVFELNTTGMAATIVFPGELSDDMGLRFEEPK